MVRKLSHSHRVTLVTSILVFFLFIAGLTGCTATGGSDRRYLQTSPSRAELVSVNKIAISQPVVSRAAQDFTGSEQRVITHLEDLLSSKSGITITSPNNADAVLHLDILVYNRRVGSDIGVTSPAQVSFVLSLLDARGGAGKMIWNATYAYQDRSVSEDLFSLGSRLSSNSVFSWRTADALLDEGLAMAIDAFVEARTSQFEHGRAQ
jgi:hypothetical protein